MNDRQVDELLALEAIYPDTASWRLVSAETGAKDEQVVEVKVVLPVEFEEEVEVEVWDYVAPSPSSSSVSVAEREGKSCGGQDLAKRVEGLKVGEEKMPEKAVRAGTGGGGNGGKGRRRRTGGGAGNGGGKALAADAAPFQPSLPPAQPRNGQRSRAAPATVPAASESKRSPASARIAVPSPPLSASPLLASPPSLAAEGKTLRIRFAPRAPSPPPVPVAPTPSSSMGTTVAAPPQPVKLRLRYLPPLEMTISLGAGYPETEGPKEIKLREKEAEKEKEETVKWVGEERLREAEGRLKEAYLPGEESLFSIVDLLTSTSSTFLPTLSLSLPLVLRQVSPVPSSALLSSSIASFNSRSLSARFSATSHLCPLCFSPSRGSSCIRLSSCNCTFCTPCLKDYFSLLITEGLVRSVACPSRGCVEERAAWEKRTGGKGREEDVPGRVEGDEVERLCGKEGRERWEWLKEKVRVESDKRKDFDPTIAFCPIPSCQAACPKVEDEEKLRICPKCSYSFCLFCRSTWHGVRNQCALPQSSAIVTSYLAGDATEKASLEMRYGAANLKRLVAAYEEERLLREWLEENATRCPGCDIPIEKSHGCNHVTCAKCQTHLCYRCGKSISPTDPYKHFSTPGGRCYGHLFDFNPGHEPGVEEWIGEIIAEDEAGGVGH
ncbi:hypothetical protein JCM11251_000066 [Rhodosporidiobolus azoricus]